MYLHLQLNDRHFKEVDINYTKTTIIMIITAGSHLLLNVSIIKRNVKFKLLETHEMSINVHPH